MFAHNSSIYHLVYFCHCLVKVSGAPSSLRIVAKSCLSYIIFLCQNYFTVMYYHLNDNLKVISILFENVLGKGKFVY